jgi:hypothetical protein
MSSGGAHLVSLNLDGNRIASMGLVALSEALAHGGAGQPVLVRTQRAEVGKYVAIKPRD